MSCEKIKFDTEEDARDELFRIVENTTFKPWKDKKPSRYYKCTICDGWHLTSQIYYEN